MSIARQGSQGHILNRYTSAELVIITSPCLISLAIGTVVFSWPPTILGWLSCGLFGLLIAIGSGRTSTIGFSLIEWPRPETKGDIAVNAIAYNGVLVLGTALGQVVWSISNSLLLAGGTGMILPLWFLKHIHLLVFLDET